MTKREKKKWRKFLQQQEQLLELHLTNLLVEELKHDMKMRRACLKRARKRAKRLRYIQ